MLTPQIKYYVIKQKYLELNFEFRKIFNQQTLLPTYNTYLRRWLPYVVHICCCYCRKYSSENSARTMAPVLGLIWKKGRLPRLKKLYFESVQLGCSTPT